jgi:hypothetical protein
MIKLINILKEIAGDVYKDDSNTWTHITNSDELIQTIKKKGEWIGKNENLKDFQYDVSTETFILSRNNSNSPNFYKGKLYPSKSFHKYLITFKPNKSYPGDDFESLNWKEVDYPLIPNSNRINKISFNKSGDIGVLKPEYRDIKNFKFYQLDPNTKKFIEFDINTIE